jgi:hypothetical protein
MKTFKVLLFVVLWTFVASRQQSRRYDLRLLQVKQQTDYYSGPAAGESILRYFGLTPEILGIKDNHQIYQSHLANQMWTDFYRSTSTYNWWQAINHFIQIHSLNFDRPYELREVQPGYSNKEEFFNIVTTSLSQNVPVVLVTGTNRRFLVITGVTGNSEHATYSYMNPIDGMFHIFQSAFIPFIFTGADQPDAVTAPNHILAYLPENARLVTDGFIPSSTKCSFLVLPSYVLSAYNENGEIIVPPLNSPFQQTELERQKRSDFEIIPSNSGKSCNTVDIMNPFRSTDDHIRVWFRLLQPNGIEVKLTRETAISLIKIYIEHDRRTFLDYATSLMEKIIQVGKVLETDQSHAAQVLYEGMPYIHQVVNKMNTEENVFKRNFIFLQTYRKYNFQETVKKRGMEKTVFQSNGENV